MPGGHGVLLVGSNITIVSNVHNSAVGKLDEVEPAEEAGGK